MLQVFGLNLLLIVPKYRAKVPLMAAPVIPPAAPTKAPIGEEMMASGPPLRTMPRIAPMMTPAMPPIVAAVPSSEFSWSSACLSRCLRVSGPQMTFFAGLRPASRTLVGVVVDRLTSVDGTSVAVPPATFASIG